MLSSSLILWLVIIYSQDHKISLKEIDDIIICRIFFIQLIYVVDFNTNSWFVYFKLIVTKILIRWDWDVKITSTNSIYH